MAGGQQPIGKVETVWAAGHEARLYTPTSAVASAEPGPLLVFFHGGGFIYGDLDSHDAAVRFLAEESGVRVLAVDYRLAPEAPFPAAYDDAVEDSLIGKQVEVTTTAVAPRALRLMLGDHSKVALPG